MASRSTGKTTKKKAPKRAPRAGTKHPAAPETAEAPVPTVPVVGIGASAGGLEAFTQMLEALDGKPGVALVFVQHLAPQHESALPTLLAARTPLPVIQVTEGVTVEVDRVYVIPPNAQMEIRDGQLHLNPRPGDRSQYNPIDFFFRSLAEAAQAGAIGVVLSGSSSDGSAGLLEIKAVGGITIAQDPKTARYDGMPRAAIATQSVDLVLSPADIAKEIRRIGSHPYLRAPAPKQEAERLATDDGDFRRLFGMLRNASGIDFTHYKLPTIKRRLQRRMMLLKMSDVAEYIRHLQGHADETTKLAQDILIHVTRFFRDPESFQALAEDVFPDIAANRTQETPVRIWVPGCSTGEEAYSVAISLLEFLGDQAGVTGIQIFATDVSENAVEIARTGLYPQTVTADVAPERLRRFFSKSDGGYRISKAVRDLCVFARQDLTRDPPFSKLDLIVCRNVLIYLEPVLQKKLLNVFHYALKPTGYLMLGHAETTGPYAELFSLANKRHRIYRKKVQAQVGTPAFPVEYSAQTGGAAPRKAPEARTPSVQTEAQRLMLERYAPPGVIIDDDMRIVQFLGHTGRFLEPAPGDVNQALPKMLREGLLHGFRTALQAARREATPARRSGLRVRLNGHDLEVAIEIVPLAGGTQRDRHYLVLFHEGGTSERVSGGRGKTAKGRAGRGPGVAKLQDELAASRDYLQSIIQELEAANEELQSANEEILSSNEELQSTNEELDTAKEELQSMNEELNTVNEELHGRNEELSRANGDLLNLLGSVQATLVIVENDLRIRRFTPMAERVLNLIPADVGRPIGHIKPNIDCPDLEELIHNTVENVTPVEREVRDRLGHWFSLQIRPYKGVDNRIDGAVLALFDIDARKRYEDELSAARAFAEELCELVSTPIVTLDRALKVRTVNRAFRETFGAEDGTVEGRPIFEVLGGLLDVADLRRALEGVAANSRPFDGLRIDREVPSAGRRTLSIAARQLPFDGKAERAVVMTIELQRGRAGRDGS
jgi:two-component system CheB/CheR fusion protein